MKKIVKEDWEDLKKEGFVLNGFVKGDNWIIREIIHKSNMQTAMLYLIILSHRRTKDNECFPSIELLSKECGVSKSTIKIMINNLHDMGAIEINSGRQGVSNNYYFPAEDFYENFNDPTEKQYHARRLENTFSKRKRIKK